MLARGGAAETLRVLVIASHDVADASAVGDFLFAFRALSRHRYWYVLDPRRLGNEVDITTFDVVLLFWSASLVGPAFGPRLRERLARAPASKVAFAQDEHQDLPRRLERLAEVDARVVFTCAAERDHDAFYPSRLLPGLEARYTVLPAYVPARLERHPAAERHDPADRPLDVGYRSREPPFWFGDLARHKVLVAERLAAACRGRGLSADVSVRELDRLYGRAWLRFLASARCVLGSPSGASVVDLDGGLRRACERHLARHPAATYEAVRSGFFAHLDGRLAIDTVSARVFEATALGCTLVQVASAYGGVLEPDRHYIPIATDYGNLEDVLQRIGDRAHCREVAARAHRELVASGRYGYARFVAWFDDCLARHARRVRGAAPGRTAFHLARWLRHGQSLPSRGGALPPPRPLPALTWALRRLPAARPPAGPLSSRLLRNPRSFADKLLALATLLARAKPARALLRLRRTAAGGRPIATWQLAEDLLKLDVAVRARRGALRSREPFGVELEVERDAAGAFLWLVSVPAGAPAGGDPDGAAIVAAATSGGLAWDHARIGSEVAYAVARRRWTTISVGQAGVYRFGTLSALCRVEPTAASHLLALLGRGPAPAHFEPGSTGVRREPW